MIKHRCHAQNTRQRLAAPLLKLKQAIGELPMQERAHGV